MTLKSSEANRTIWQEGGKVNEIFKTYDHVRKQQPVAHLIHIIRYMTAQNCKNRKTDEIMQKQTTVPVVTKWEADMQAYFKRNIYLLLLPNKKCYRQFLSEKLAR